MSKIFGAYAGRRGVAPTALRFMFDGKRVKDTDTPKMLEMEDDDQIEAHLEQLGGGDEVSCCCCCSALTWCLVIL